MSDAAPPPLPPFPPPPPLPPAPVGYVPQPVIRWGVGDIFWGLLLWVVGGAIAAVAVIAGGAIDLNTVADDGVGELPVWAVAVSVAGGWIGFVGWPIVATYRKGQRSLRLDFGLDIRWIDVGWGLLGGIASVAVAVMGGVLWTVITGDSPPSNGEFLPDSPSLLEAAALWVLIALLTPIAEELFFRGLTLRALGRRWGLNVATVVSSLVFGAMHFDTSGGLAHGVFIVGVTAAYGVVFALLVRRAAGRLGPAIVAHSVVNTVGVVGLFLT